MWGKENNVKTALPRAVLLVELTAFGEKDPG